MKRKHRIIAPALFCLAFYSIGSPAADYTIDTKGYHASINFKISHLGYSWMIGRFNSFNGSFSYDENNPSAASVSVTIDTASVDTNHAERDKHLRSGDFLDVSKHPEARFVSTGYRQTGQDKGELKGDLTLRGVTRPITIRVTHIGAGPDPWGNYRRGFEGHTQFALKDYGIDYNLGPATKDVTLNLHIEGIRQ